MLARVGATPELTDSCRSRSSCCRVSRAMKGEVAATPPTADVVVMITSSAVAVPLVACLADFLGGMGNAMVVQGGSVDEV